jgi:iron complex transport system ATP-binding protein
VLALELEGISARYPGGGATTVAGVDLILGRGELCMLLGPNGAGKTTLLRVAAGVLPPVSGAVRVEGELASIMGRDERARRVALVPQRSEVALGFTVREVVAMGRAPHQRGLLRMGQADHEAVGRALAACDLTSVADRAVADLSGGEQKRVHIARALAQEAPILLLDEAAAHLDLRHALELYSLVHDAVKSRGLSCLATTHDLEAAARHADRVVLLVDGRVVADGPVAEVMTPPLLRRTFGVDVEVHAADGRRSFWARSETVPANEGDL